VSLAAATFVVVVVVVDVAVAVAVLAAMIGRFNLFANFYHVNK